MHHTATGAPIFITCSCNTERQTYFDFFGFFRLYRDADKIYDSGEVEQYNSVADMRGIFSFNITDAPSAGDHTYYFKIFIADTQLGNHNAYNRSMMLLEVKK